MPRKKVSKAKEPVRIRYKNLANGNKSIYLDIYQNGKRNYEFLKLYLVPETSSEAKIQNENTLVAANAIKSQRIIELTNDVAGIKNNGHKAKMRLTDFMIVYRDTQYAKGRYSVKPWVAATVHVINLWRPNATIREIDKQWCEDFIAWMLNDYETNKGTKVSKSTVACYLRCIRSALNLAVDSDMIAVNPVYRVKSDIFQLPESKRVFLTVEEVKKLMDTPIKKKHEQIKAAFLFSCFCGLRVSDVCKLTWRDIVQENGQCRIEITMIKTKQPLYLPLNKQAMRWLPKRGDAQVDDKVFPEVSKVHRETITKWAESAGITKHVTYHVSRHTFATMALTMGADLYTTSKLLGHKNVNTTQIYAKIVNRKKEEAVSLLDSAFE